MSEIKQFPNKALENRKLRAEVVGDSKNGIVIADIYRISPYISPKNKNSDQAELADNTRAELIMGAMAELQKQILDYVMTCGVSEENIFFVINLVGLLGATAATDASSPDMSTFFNIAQQIGGMETYHDGSDIAEKLGSKFMSAINTAMSLESRVDNGKKKITPVGYHRSRYAAIEAVEKKAQANKTDSSDAAV